jgi:CheY-like chemotaxis protein
LREHRQHLEEEVAERTVELRQATEEAVAANRAKSVFLATMSHEIRTPMNAIVGLTHLLKRRIADPRQQQQLSTIGDSAQALLAILNDILDFSKIEAGKIELESVDFSLESIFENVANLISARAAEKGVEVVTRMDRELPPVLRGDPLRLTQILLNFANNAVKFSEHGSIVLRARVIEAGESELQLRLEVQDQGIGINAEQQARLFQPFEQANEGTTRRYGGSGLGLAIAKRLTELMGGEIGVDSVVGEGSTFWSSLRLQRGEHLVVPLPHTCFEGVRALVVDDLADAREMLQVLLESMGIVADVAASGTEALQKVATAEAAGLPYRLVLLDWRMPDMDGTETARQLHALPLQHSPRIFLVTAYGTELPPDADRTVHFDAVLSKPVQRSLLVDTLANCLMNEVAADWHPKPTNFDPARAGARILLVEDNVVNQQVGCDLLEDVGLLVDVADNGAVAVDKVGREHYDLILMDMEMPVMDGIEATKRIRQLPTGAHLPILAMTANAFAEDRERCLEAGMNGHVAKPVDPDQLYKTLSLWLPLRGPEQAEVESLAAGVSEVVEAAATAEVEFLIDTAKLEARYQNKPVFIDRLLPTVAHDTEANLAKLRDILAAGDLAALGSLAHAIKGVAGSIMATPLLDCARSVELAAKAGEIDAIKQGEQLVEKVERLLREIADYQARRQAAAGG